MMNDSGYVIALGTFDGVHAGHRVLVRATVEAARTMGIKSAVYTFSNHPMEALGRSPKLLMTGKERIKTLSSLGVDKVFSDVFDMEYAAMTPEAFTDMLRTRFNAAMAVVGFNYTFGARGRGDVEMLKALASERGYSVLVADRCVFEEDTVSSTRIRSCVEHGDIEKANAMLTREYSLCGAIVKNRHIGTGIGFPTANIDVPDEKVIPAFGVYATRAELDGKAYKAVTNIGNNPTVHGSKTTVETHIIGFEGNIYGEELRVSFVRRMRDCVRFENVQALSVQISHDVAEALEILKK